MGAAGTSRAVADGAPTDVASARLPLSVFIITRNEADRIARPIVSVRDWADEVLVVDSGSTDGTVELARSLGARVVHHVWQGYGPQKRYGEATCRNDWVLNLDADEEVDDALRAAIVAVFEGGRSLPDCAAFRLYWKMVHFADDRPRRLAQRRSFVRLYDRRKASFRDSIVHDSVVVADGGTVRDVPSGIVLHRSFRSLRHFHDKLMEYAAWQARDMVERGRRPTALRVFIEPALSFARIYLIRRYFIYGRDGLAMARIYAQVRKERLSRARKAARQSSRPA